MKADAYGDAPWGEMRERIRHRLAERDVAVDPKSGEPRILRGLVRAHVVRADHEGDGPLLVVDDRKMSWPELGRMLGALEGWDIRVEIVDCLHAQSRGSLIGD